MSTVKRTLVISGWILSLGCTIYCLFDPFADYNNQKKLDKLQSKLNEAKEKWNSQNITDYSFDIVYWIPLIGECRANIAVKQGKIIEVIEKRHGGFDDLRESVILDLKKWDSDYCHYSSFTIPEVFEDIQNKINSRITIDANFSSEFGFVTRYYGNQNVSRGLLYTQVSESEFSYAFSNFQKFHP